MSKKIKESGQYENCLDLLHENKRPVDSLFDFEDDSDGWQKHWRGMPEFEQNDNGPWKTIKVHFKTEQDYQEFCKLIGQQLTEKTKSTWHPEQNTEKNALFRWIEE